MIVFYYWVVTIVVIEVLICYFDYIDKSLQPKVLNFLQAKEEIEDREGSAKVGTLENDLIICRASYIVGQKSLSELERDIEMTIEYYEHPENYDYF